MFKTQVPILRKLGLFDQILKKQVNLLEWIPLSDLLLIKQFTRYDRRDDYDDERLEGQDKTMGLGLCGVVRA